MKRSPDNPNKEDAAINTKARDEPWLQVAPPSDLLDQGEQAQIKKYKRRSHCGIGNSWGRERARRIINIREDLRHNVNRNWQEKTNCEIFRERKSDAIAEDFPSTLPCKRQD